MIFSKSFEEFILYQNKTLTKSELLAELGFMYRYNFERRHSALKYITPLDKIRRIAEMLPNL